ncbi:serine/threonine-protein kinase [Spirillospora sp. CA-294931]|uniref:serine/threonine-protein kinase n=1 Tax=Spirillospora sp. CA-294931 TaxID=3240042 RepID=UPI003D93DB17
MPGWAELLPEDPRAVGPFAVAGRLGGGGQGTVYAGTAPEGTAVAIKLLHPHLAQDERARERFLREAEAAKAVARFCTVQIVGSGVFRQRPYIVSEYVDGPSLLDAVTADGPRSGAALDRLAIGTATALAAIHRAGIVHRDFKPGNVLLGPDGPVVIDFGIARALTDGISTTSQVVGSPSYMAPEQIAGDPVGPPADLFAWGVTMVYAAGGVKAFTGESIPAIMQSILHDEPDLGPLTGHLRDLVRRCLAKAPADRPTAREVADALLDGTAPDGVAPVAAERTSAAEAGVAAETRQPPARARRWRRPGVVAVVAAVALLVLCGVLASEFAGGSDRDGKDVSGPRPTEGAAASVAASGPTAPASGRSGTATPGRGSPATSGPSSGKPTSGNTKRPGASPTQSKPVTRPRTSRKPSGAGTPIGTMPYSVLTPYCKSRGYASGVTLANGPHCVTEDQQYVPINMNSVCRYKFPAYPNAVLQSYNSVGGSWTCLSH